MDILLSGLLWVYSEVVISIFDFLENSVFLLACDDTTPPHGWAITN
jgi:hypothetical protein